MAPELRAYLDAMEQRMTQHTDGQIAARQEADRLDAAREQVMLNQHVLPLKASTANYEKRIKAVESR